VWWHNKSKPKPSAEGIPSSQALLGFRITAPLSVLIPAVLGAPAVCIFLFLGIDCTRLALQAQQCGFKNQKKSTWRASCVCVALFY